MNERRTRVLLMASSMRGGGSEHQVALLAEHLPRDQFEVHLFLTYRVGELLERLPDDVTIHSPDTEAPSLIEKILNRWPGRILRKQAEVLDEVLRQEQIDVVYDRAFHNTLIAGHRRVRTPVRRVSTIVSPPHLALPSVEKRFVELKRRRLADAYRRSDAVIAVSDAVAESASNYYGLARERITVVRNPVAFDPNVLDPEQPPDGAVVSPDRTLRMVCVGRMSSEKGQGDLVEAIALLPNPWPRGVARFRFEFIGDGALRASIQDRVESLADQNGTIGGHEIHFRGIISPAVREIAEADGLVCPSHFEGMPNVILEAFALGVPVVATRSGGSVELQGEADQPTCFWAEPANPPSLADALLTFAEDDVGRAQQAQNALRWVREHHTIDVVIERIAAILRAG